MAFERRRHELLPAPAPRAASGCPVSSTCSTCPRLDGEDVRRAAAARAQGAPRGVRSSSAARSASTRTATASTARSCSARPAEKGLEGSDRQARRQPLPERRPLARLAQAQVPRRAGARDRRLHGAEGLAHGLRRAARRLLRGRRTLRYAGKVGTGFDHAHAARRSATRMRELERDESAVRRRSSRSRAGTHWVRPELVAQIGFAEWTRDGRLRHPRYLGLRDDKPARDVVRERARRDRGDHPSGQAAVPRRRASRRRTSPRTTSAWRSGCCRTCSGRPVSLQRFPDGIDGKGFFHKDMPDYFPDWIKRVEVPKANGTVTHVVICGRRHARLPRRPEHGHAARVAVARRPPAAARPARDRPRPAAGRRLRRGPARRALDRRADARARFLAVRAGHRLEGHPRVDPAAPSRRLRRGARACGATSAACSPRATPTS